MENVKVAIIEDLNVLTRLAILFRAAIQRCDPQCLPVTLRNFSHGSCGDAALLLAKYLQENGCGIFDYMLGQREGHSHAWLQRDDLIIDISGDQFDDQNVSVIVTRDNSWHTGFNGHALHVADFCIYDQHTASELWMAYEIIKRALAD